MDWYEIVASIGGLAGVGTALWTLINFRAKKQMETANADLQTAQADRQTSDNWQQLADELKAERNEYKQELSIIKETQNSLLVRVTVLEGDKHYAEFHFCDKIECPNRKPPIGTFRGRRHKVDEDNETDK